jgi:4-hydroxybenzoate polyprenyltransferase
MADKGAVIVVDLEESLVGADLHFEESLRRFKRFFSGSTDSLQRDIPLLPWNVDLLRWLRQRSEEGASLHLISRAAPDVLTAVARHLGIFEKYSSLHGQAVDKDDFVRRQLGQREFQLIDARCPGTPPWSRHEHGLANWISALRPHQWIKNLLVFVPLLTSHAGQAQVWLLALAGFLLFGLCASSAYLLNDILDIPNDRHHFRKRNRPFARGALPPKAGLALSASLAVTALATAALLSPPFAVVLAAYYTLTLAYSIRLKRAPVVDVLTLAVLYTVRIVAGAVLVGIPLSYWLGTFSIFLFLSLALLKRYIELVDMQKRKTVRMKGRAYASDDAQMLSSQGTGAGYIAVMVFCLYINSAEVSKLYQAPSWLWGIGAVLLYWINRAWWLAHRGKLHDDPIVFAVKDRVSLALAAVAAILLALSS